MPDPQPLGKGQSPRCGFVVLLGAPNAGKSTLLNFAVGAKVAIVTPKVQTTRSRITGIMIRNEAQVAFVDTPGLFEPKRRFDRAMVAAAWAGLKDADLAVLVVDADRAAKAPRAIDPDTDAAIATLKQRGARIMLALNKIDLVPRERLLEITRVHDATGVFSDIFMISAVTGDGVADLLDEIIRRLPEGPWLYPEDQLSDVPLRLLAAEITREQVFLQLHQELPYALAVETESWEERDDGSVRIEQTLYIERKSQKGMVVGKGGARIKSIGAEARKELIKILDRPVHLFLHAKVRGDWAERAEHYRALGLDFKA